MKPNTGAIAHFETNEDAKAAGHTVPLDKKQTELLMGMNRQQRRAYFAEQRREAKKK